MKWKKMTSTTNSKMVRKNSILMMALRTILKKKSSEISRQKS
jgi:hypothetical protein